MVTVQFLQLLLCLKIFMYVGNACVRACIRTGHPWRGTLGGMKQVASGENRVAEGRGEGDSSLYFHILNHDVNYP